MRYIYNIDIYIPLVAACDHGPSGDLASLQLLHANALMEVKNSNIIINHVFQSIAGFDFLPQKLQLNTLFHVPDILKAQIKLNDSISYQKSSRTFLHVFGKFDLRELLEYQKTNKLFKSLSKKDIARFFLSYELQTIGETLSLFIVALNLAKPGCCLAEEGYACIDGEIFSKTPPVYHRLNDYLYEQWPKVEFLDIKKTWAWVQKQPGFLRGLSDNKISRALNAFTYSFDTEEKFELFDEFFWSMLGLEAIYTNGHQGIMQQFIEKSNLLIEHEQGFERAVKKMYNYRSRLLHGQKDIPSRYKNYEDENVNKYDIEFFDTCTLARKMLLVTLQKLIKDDLLDIDFVYNAVKIN